MSTKQTYGPQTYQIKKVIEKLETLTSKQSEELGAALYAARHAAWDAARDAARDAAWYVARGAAWDVARGAARGAAWYAIAALLVRDLIGEKFTQAHYELLTKPWRDVMGEFEEPEGE